MIFNGRVFQLNGLCDDLKMKILEKNLVFHDLPIRVKERASLSKLFRRAVLRLVDLKAKTKAQNSSYVTEIVLFWGRLSKLYQRVKSVIQEEVPSMEYNTVVQAEEKVPVNEEALYQHQQVTAAAESVSVSSTQQVAPKPKKTVQINESRDSQSEEIRRLEQELRDARKQIEILSR